MRSISFRTRAVAGLSALALAGSGLLISSAVAGGKDTKSEHWGVVNRNTAGSPVADLRDGPYVIGSTGLVSAPPLGKGSLEIETANASEHAAFGNEVDFFGDPVSDLNQAGFYVYRTGEDIGYGGDNNLPNIQIEINPHVAGRTYTSLVWNPDGTDYSQVPVNEWSGFIDARTNGYWYFSNGSVATATGCTQAASCDLQDALNGLASQNDGSGSATIGSISVAKGRDYQFQGAVDGLRINDKSYDFEAQPEGVHAKGVK